MLIRKVELRMNEEYKYKIIKKLVETNGNKQRAAVTLKKSIRQIDRMIALKMLLSVHIHIWLVKIKKKTLMKFMN